MSILIGFGATFAILLIGVIYGAISGFVGGRLDNGMMRFLDALYGLPYLPFAIITLADHRPHRQVDDDDRALDRELVHDRAHRPRPGDHAEGERLRACGESRGGALVPGPGPASAAEHARHPDHRDLPRAARGRSSARRSCRSSASASARPTPPGARWRRRAATAYRVHPIEIVVPSLAIATLVHLRQLHRGRPARRARPEDEGDIGVALLEVDDLRTHFFTREGEVRAVDGVSFSVEKGKTLGIVGESGCGKSVTALSIMGLIPKPPAKIVSGSVMFEGQDLTKLSEKQLEDVRGREIAMIFQDPMTSLNPTLTIGTQITETIRRHYDVSTAQASKRAVELLEEVRIPRAAERLTDYPAPLLGRDAAARDDRDRALVRPQAADRRRADDRARRDRAGVSARPARRPAPRARDGDDHHHARHGRRRRGGRRHPRHVRRADRRAAPRRSTCSTTRSTRTPRRCSARCRRSKAKGSARAA